LRRSVSDDESPSLCVLSLIAVSRPLNPALVDGGAPHASTRCLLVHVCRMRCPGGLGGELQDLASAADRGVCVSVTTRCCQYRARAAASATANHRPRDLDACSSRLICTRFQQQRSHHASHLISSELNWTADPVRAGFRGGGIQRAPGPRPPTIERPPTKLLIFYFLLINQLVTSL